MPTKPVKHESNVLQFWSIALLISFIVIALRNCQNSHQFIATSISSGLIGLVISSYYFKKKYEKKLKY